MKTKIRIIEGKLQLNGYKHTDIQILDLAYPNQKQSKTLTPIGRITWQGDTERDYMYGMSFSVNTDNPEHLLKMYKVAKYIKENSNSDIQPDEVINLIGGEKHMLYNGEYIPIDYVGMRAYKVMRIRTDNEKIYYSRIYAATDIQAKKMLEKNYPTESSGVYYELEFIEIIPNFLTN